MSETPSETLSEIPTILHQATSWLAINKPALWSVHNEPGADLVSYLRKLDKAFAQASPIHRLDVGTSGVIIFALTPQTAQAFGALLQTGGLQKQYIGIAEGVPKGAVAGVWQEWTMAISRKAEGRKNPAGLSKDRMPSTSRYCLGACGPKRATLLMEPVSGRKHQLRRHSAIAGCALLGDERYGNKQLAAKLREVLAFDRLALHAQRLSFTDPISGKKIILEAPVPTIFATLLDFH